MKQSLVLTAEAESMILFFNSVSRNSFLYNYFQTSICAWRQENKASSQYSLWRGVLEGGMLNRSELQADTNLTSEVWGEACIKMISNCLTSFSIKHSWNSQLVNTTRLDFLKLMRFICIRSSVAT